MQRGPFVNLLIPISLPEFIKKINFFFTRAITEILFFVMTFYTFTNDRQEPRLTNTTTRQMVGPVKRSVGKLAQYSEVNFSVDGLEDTNHLYRQGVKWEKVEDNMVAFCDAGGLGQVMRF